MSEFNLSDEEWEHPEMRDVFCYSKEDVKEFIRLLKEDLQIFKMQTDTGYEEGKIMYRTLDVYGRNLVEQIIDKLAGDKLI